ncbi:unnamed protein product, partial [Symbiodinium microadriaticum]
QDRAVRQDRLQESGIDCQEDALRCLFPDQSTSPSLADPKVGSVTKNLFAVGGGPEFRGAGVGVLLGIEGGLRRWGAITAPVFHLMALVTPASVLQGLEGRPAATRRCSSRRQTIMTLCRSHHAVGLLEAAKCSPAPSENFSDTPGSKTSRNSPRLFPGAEKLCLFERLSTQVAEEEAHKILAKSTPDREGQVNGKFDIREQVRASPHDSFAVPEHWSSPALRYHVLRSNTRAN